MFCTGGIRCEKAGPLLERQGFREVYQLDGGILKYFEECGGEHYDGACFVFEEKAQRFDQFDEGTQILIGLLRAGAFTHVVQKTETLAQIAERIGKHSNSVEGKARRLHLPARKQWSAAEDALMRAGYGIKPLEQLARVRVSRSDAATLRPRAQGSSLARHWAQYAGLPPRHWARRARLPVAWIGCHRLTPTSLKAC